MMKKTTKILLLLAVLLIFCGVLLGCITLATLGLPAGEQYRTYRTEHAGDIGLITADLGSAAILLKPTSGEEIYVICNDVEDDRRITVTEQDGVLHVENNPNRFRIFDIGSWFNFHERPEYDVEIAIPAAYAGRLEIDTASGAVFVGAITCASAEISLSSGTVCLQKMQCTGSLEVGCTSGRIEVEDVICGGNMSVDGTSGSILLDGLTLDGSLEIVSTSGSLQVKYVEAAGDITAELTGGSFRITNITCGKNINLRTVSGPIVGHFLTAKAVAAETTSGRIRLQVIDADSIRLETSSGNIDSTVADEQESYTIVSSTTSGSNNLPEKQSGGAKRLEVHTTSGSVRIGFHAHSVLS